jgi:hypothetical protein
MGKSRLLQGCVGHRARVNSRLLALAAATYECNGTPCALSPLLSDGANQCARKTSRSFYLCHHQGGTSLYEGGHQYILFLHLHGYTSRLTGLHYDQEARRRPQTRANDQRRTRTHARVLSDWPASPHRDILVDARFVERKPVAGGASEEQFRLTRALRRSSCVPDTDAAISFDIISSCSRSRHVKGDELVWPKAMAQEARFRCN